MRNEPAQQTPVELPPLLATVHALAERALARWLKAFFDNLDDALFELADRSRSDHDQQMFFESMREMRLCRRRIEEDFLGELRGRFERICVPPALAPGRDVATDDDGVAALSLVRNDDLEVAVAIAGIVSKIGGRFSLSLMQLARRLDVLCPRHEVTERNNPLGPQQMCDCFVVALSSVQLDIKVRIILLKLFERVVMEELGALYDDVNRTLADAGILKNIRAAMRPRARNGNGRPVAPRAGQQPPAGSPDASGAWSEPGTQAGFGPHAAGGHAAGAPWAVPAGGQAHGGLPGDGAPAAMHAGAYPFDAGSGGFAGGAGPAGGTRGAGTQAGSGAGPADGHAGTGAPVQAFAGGAWGAGSPGIPGGVAADAFQPLSDVDLGFAPTLLQWRRSDVAAAPSGPPLAPGDVLAALSAAQRAAAAAPLVLDSAPRALDLRPVLLAEARGIGAAGAHLAGGEEDVVNLVGLIFEFILNDRNQAIPMKALLARLQIPYLKLAFVDRTFFRRAGHPARQLLNELASAGIGWSRSQELKRDALYDLIESLVVRVLNRFDGNVQLFDDLLAELRQFVHDDARRNQVVEQRMRDAELGRTRATEAKAAIATLINQRAGSRELPEEVRGFVRDVFSRILTFTYLKNGPASGEWQQAVGTLDELLECAAPMTELSRIGERERTLPRLLMQLRDGVATVGADAGSVEVLERVLRVRADLDRAVLRGTPKGESLFTVRASLLPETPRAADPETPLTEAEAAAVGRITVGTWVELKRDSDVLRGKLTTILEDGNRFVFVSRRGMKLAERSRRQLARELVDGRATVLDERALFERAMHRVVSELRQRQQPA